MSSALELFGEPAARALACALPNNKPRFMREFATANCRLGSRHIEHLKGFGVPKLVRIGAPPVVGVEYLDTADCERYLPQESGNPAYVVPIFDGGPQSLVFNIYDLVAFKPRQPNAWRLRNGNSVLLGPDWPEWCRLHEEPLRLFSNPLEWLRGSGQGSCIIDWSASLRLYLSDVPVIICDSVGLAKRVSASLSDIGRLPQIRLPKEALNVAA